MNYTPRTKEVTTRHSFQSQLPTSDKIVARSQLRTQASPRLLFSTTGRLVACTHFTLFSSPLLSYRPFGCLVPVRSYTRRENTRVSRAGGYCCGQPARLSPARPWSGLSQAASFPPRADLASASRCPPGEGGKILSVAGVERERKSETAGSMVDKKPAPPYPLLATLPAVDEKKSVDSSTVRTHRREHSFALFTATSQSVAIL